METVVTKEVVDLNSLLKDVMSSEDVLTSAPKVPNILSSNDDNSYLKPGVWDNEEEKEKEKIEEGKEKERKEKLEEKQSEALPLQDKEKVVLGNTFLDEVIKTTEEEENKGRPKTEKSSLTSYLKSKIEAEEFEAFDDWDEKKETIDEYLSKQSEKNLHELLDANWQSREKKLLEQTPKEFFEALPEELQYAADYVFKGGQDLKGLFTALARVEQVKSLDPSTEEGQVAIARNYLQAKDFGTAEQIEDEIENYRETNRLEKKANEFKPKLDAMQKDQVAYQLRQQEEFNKQQQIAAQAYTSNMYKALEKGDLNGIKLDRKKQAELYTGLTSMNYPSASGKATNLLGHLLDKIQFIEPNFTLLAEATYLLQDPEGYRNAIKQQGKNAAIEDTARKLKSEQMNTGVSGIEDDYEDKHVGKKKILKPRNIFERS